MLSTVHKRPRSVFTSDAEEHTRFRRMLSKPFTFKRVEGLRPAIQQITDDAIDALLAGPKPGDIVSALALPVPGSPLSDLASPRALRLGAERAFAVANGASFGTASGMEFFVATMRFMRDQRGCAERSNEADAWG